MKFETFKEQSRLRVIIEDEEKKLQSIKNNFSFDRKEVEYVRYEFVLKSGRRSAISEERSAVVIDKLYQIRGDFIKRFKRKVKALHNQFENLK